MGGMASSVATDFYFCGMARAGGCLFFFALLNKLKVWSEVGPLTYWPAPPLMKPAAMNSCSSAVVMHRYSLN